MDFYLDASAVGGAYQAYADAVTTWGTPQDGNGLGATASSAAVPVAEVTFAAVPTSGTISVYGVTVTLTGVLSAASTAAAATALASSINATTTAASSASAISLALNRFVYARVKPGGGANDSIVQIMCRIAGSDLNYPALSAARVVNTFNNSAMTSPVNFTGGVDGPFGYYLNNSTVFGKSAYTYGALAFFSPAFTEPGSNDVIHVRTKASGTNITVTVTTDAALTAGPVQRNFRYDDGTIWSGDSGVFSFHYNNGSSGGQRFWALPPSNHIAATPYNFVWQFTCGSGGYVQIYGTGSTTSINFTNVKFEEQAGTPSGAGGFRFQNTHQDACWLDLQYPRRFVEAGTYSIITRFERCKFTARNMSAKWTQFINIASAAGSNGDVIIEFRGGEFDSANAFTADTPVTGNPTAGNVRIVFDSVKNLDFSVAGFTASSRYSLYSFLYVAPDENRQFRYECGTHIVDWRTGQSYPTLSAVLPNGNAWVQRLLWQPVTAPNKQAAAIKLSMYHRAADGVRTLALNFLMPTALALTKAEIALLVRYQDSSGVVRHETTLLDWSTKLRGIAAAVDASSASWTGAPGGYSAKKLEVVTSQAVKQNTEIQATLMLVGSPATQQVLYVDPELAVA